MSEKICDCKFQKARKCYDVVHSWFEHLNVEPFDSIPYSQKYAWLMIALGKKQHIIPTTDDEQEEPQKQVEPVKKNEVGELVKTPYDEDCKKSKTRNRKK